MSELYVGLISGTSVDAVDAALVEFSAPTPRLRAAHSHPIPAALRGELLALTAPGANELERMARADVAVGRLFADAALALLDQAGCPAAQVRALGSHGQTLRHLPESPLPTTVQIGDPNIVAELTGITTVADFRRRDMAAGGQGAPLVPAFHAAVFRSVRHNRAIVNIGGIANVTLLPADALAPVSGFDTGPGNGLLDEWAARHLSTSYDDSGAWAAGGSVDQELLAALVRDTYFAAPAPKSTGREYFNLNWLESRCGHIRDLRPQDVQASLCELTATTIADAMFSSSPPVNEVFVCGGGVHNRYLMERLEHACGTTPVKGTDELGVAPEWVEAMAFAWLAKQTMAGKPGNLPSVTGAQRAVVLGAIYPAQARDPARRLPS